MTLPYQRTLSLSLVAAAATGIALSQSGTAATPLTINGSLATGGVATFDVPRRVGITSAGNDSGITFTIVGTDYYGRTQTEVLKGANTTVAQTTHDFATVTSITPSGNTASTVTSGTTSVGSTQPMVIDSFANPTNISLAGIVTGTVNYTVEECYDDLAPDWNVNANTPTWFATSITGASTNTTGTLTSPANLVRLTINSGTGAALVRVLQGFIAGRL